MHASTAARVEMLHLNPAWVNDYLAHRPSRRGCMDGSELRAAGATCLHMRRVYRSIVAVETTVGNCPRAIVGLMDCDSGLLGVQLMILLREAYRFAATVIARAHHFRSITVTSPLFIGVLCWHNVLSLTAHVFCTPAEVIGTAGLTSSVALALHDLAADGVRLGLADLHGSLDMMTRSSKTLHLDILNLTVSHARSLPREVLLLVVRTTLDHTLLDLV